MSRSVAGRRSEHAHHRNVVLTAAMALAVASIPAAAEQATPAPEVRRSAHHVTLERAREGAARRLEKASCLGLLDEFKDQKGEPLTKSLATWNRSAGDYLATAPFRDGSSHPPCRTGKTALFSVVGMRPIFVCPTFTRAAERDPWTAEVWMIHEMLHTLGLGENPPTSREITERVSARCGSD